MHERQASHAQKADLVDDLARWVASPVSRRGAFKLGAAAFAGMAAVPLRTRTAFAPPAAFAQGGSGNCIGPGQNCRAITCEAPAICCHAPNLLHKPENDCGVYCCDPCNPTSSQCGPDGHCVAGPVAQSCCTASGGVVCGNECCSKDQQCLSPPAVANGPLCYACPEEITDLDKCPNRKQIAEPDQNGCGPAGTTPAISEFLNKFKDANFKPACNTHDTCYGTCNQTQQQCDAAFRDNLQKICITTYSDDFDHKAVCLSQSRQYYRAVSTLGRKAYEQAQRENCQCCPKYPLDSSQLPPAPPSSRPNAPDTLVPQNNRVKVPVTCSGSTACDGTLGLSVSAGSGAAGRSGMIAATVRPRRMIPLGTAAFSIPAGQNAQVKVPLSREGRRLLRERKRLTVLVTARAQLANGKQVDTGLDSFVLTARSGARR